MSLSEASPAGSPRGRVVLTLLVVMAASFGLRLHRFGDLAVDQFDEGAYAMSAAAVAAGTWPEGGYPTQHYLAPPLLFGSAGWTARLAGIGAEEALLGIVAALGALTSLLAFVVVRGLVSPAAGLGAAAFVALSDYHVLYSRIGLTDVPFAFFFLLAVGAYSFARQRNGAAWWIVAGVCTGLAWNTKYHGWLAGVIAASALCIDVVFPPAGRTRGGIAARFALAVTVACACYLPWALHIFGEPGGYAEVMAQHRSFLHPETWGTNALRQMQAQLYCDGWLSRAAPGAALLLVASATGRVRVSTVFAAVALSVLACAATGAAVAVVLAFVGVATVLRDRSRRSWQLAAWAACFTILTPMYHPYVRLALPFLLATWCLAGVGADTVVGLFARRPGAGWLTGGAALLVAAAILGGGARPDLGDSRTRALATWQAKDSIPRVARELARSLPAGAVVDVVGEPPLVHHLRLLGFDARHRDRLDHLRRLKRGEEAFVVIGLYGRITSLRPLMRARRLQVEKRATSWFSVGEVRRLNDMLIGDALRQRARGERGYEVDLYAVGVK